MTPPPPKHDPATVLGEALLRSSPEELFTPDFTIAKKEYRMLMRRFHPDLGGDADKAATVQTLYAEALRKLAEDDWQLPGLLQLRSIDGRRYEMPYVRRHAFDLGDMYIGERNVAFVLPESNEDLFKHGVRMIAKVEPVARTRPDDAGRWLPQQVATVRTLNKLALVVKKHHDTVCMRDMLDHMGGKLDPRHVAWLVSRLYHIACLLNFEPKVAHVGLDPLSLFVDPGAHSVAVLGGWWFAQAIGAPLVALPPRAAGLLALGEPRPLAYARHMGELVRSVGRELLGDANGSRLLLDSSLPAPMVSWLRSPASDNIYDDYKIWYRKVLKECFGKPKFVELNLSVKQVYGA
jgi:hypothetical protein